MNLVDQIKDRCTVDDITKCWIWKGATSASNGGKFRQPRVHAVDFTADPTGNTKTLQTGNRAVWHAYTGKPIPKGHRVYKSHCCANGLCVNPAHLACGTTTDWGATVSKKGHWKGAGTRIQANRATGRGKSDVTPDIAREILASSETGRELAGRLNLNCSVISRVRTGKLVSVLVHGNPFAGLIT